jgi:hypothetical protein
MEDPNNPTVAKDDPLLGLWVNTHTAIAGAALNGRIIARRGGCYVVPRTPHGLLDLVGRNTLWDRLNLAGANPATDIIWSEGIAARPPSNVDWKRLLRELFRKYEWVAGTVERLNKDQRT